MHELKNIVVELSELNIQTGFGYKLNIPYNYVIYFEKEQNKELSLYIRKNFEALKTRFASIDLNFIYLPLVMGSLKNLEEVIAYYFPQLNYYQIPNIASKEYSEKIIKQAVSIAADGIDEVLNKDSFIPSKIDSDELLNLLDYKGNIKSGLLFLNMHYGAIGVPDFFYSSSIKNYEWFFDDVLLYLKREKEDYSLSDGDFSFDLSYLPTYSEQLDDGTKELVKDIENRLTELKDSGQLLFLIPILKDLLNSQSQKIDFNSLSKMEIDYQNKIQLLYFKKEVELSHLTKSIYFLFLKHPEGINLRELSNYKKELLTIYTSVSNQLDYDKMAKSIDDVINIETKAIYTHLSRIKSSFYKIMDDSFARHYIISGSGEEDRKVLFNTFSITWKNHNSLDDFDL
jgi:hypothetical protein